MIFVVVSTHFFLRMICLCFILITLFLLRFFFDLVSCGFVKCISNSLVGVEVKHKYFVANCCSNGFCKVRLEVDPWWTARSISVCTCLCHKKQGYCVTAYMQNYIYICRERPRLSECPHSVSLWVKPWHSPKPRKLKHIRWCSSSICCCWLCRYVWLPFHQVHGCVCAEMLARAFLEVKTNWTQCPAFGQQNLKMTANPICLEFQAPMQKPSVKCTLHFCVHHHIPDKT